MKKYLYLFGCTAILSSSLHAENIHLVKDMNEHSLLEIKECNGMFFYSIQSVSNVTDLWRSDGTTNGTEKLAAFNTISGLSSYNNKLYFIAWDSLGNELWTTDGTVAGTHRVKDINPGYAFAFRNEDYLAANQIKVLAGKMFFIADDGTHGRELWTSDGTDTGTHMVTDLNTLPGQGIVGINNGNNFLPASFEVFNNALYFYGNDSSGNNGLWTYDGVSASPVFIKSVYPSSFMTDGTRLFFGGVRSDTSVMVNSLYQTDGTTAGTTVIKDSVGTSPDYAVLNGSIYFYGRPSDTDHNNKIYKTDGTAQGTIVLKDYAWAPGLNISNRYNSKTVFLTAFNNKVYFSYYGLWATDGTIGGTGFIYNSPANAFTKSITYPVVAHNKLYFKASDSTRTDFWYTDGTLAGTHEVIDLYMPYTPTPPLIQSEIVVSPTLLYGDNLYFMNRYDTAVGMELYKMDFEPTGVKTVNSVAQTGVVYPNPAGDIIKTNNTHVAMIAVYDITGKKLLSATGQQANVSALQQGIYIAEMTDDTGVRTTAKFTKQ